MIHNPPAHGEPGHTCMGSMQAALMATMLRLCDCAAGRRPPFTSEPFDGPSWRVPCPHPSGAFVTLVNVDGENENFTMCIEHALELNHITGGPDASELHAEVMRRKLAEADR